MSTREDDAPRTKTYAEEAACAMVYYAAERTLMAWVRVALGMMALGFVIDRFGLVLRQILPAAGIPAYSRTFSFCMGAAFVLLGTVMAGVASVRYYRFSRSYHREGGTEPRHGIMIGVLFTVILTALGLVIFIFLVIETD